jgi:hypothetical protein
MKLRVKAFGMAVGLVSGGGLFVATILDVVREKGITLSSLQSFFLGYDISYVGACVGLIWGFVYGFIFGALLAWLYNILLKILYKSEGSGV